MQREPLIGTFRIGDPARESEGLRIATTRRPPRGVPKERWTKDGWFDVWLPVVAPSAELLASHRRLLDEDATWRRFARAYLAEMEKLEARQTIDFLAHLGQRLRISVGCYCEDEAHCHRSLLRRAIEERIPGA